MEVEVVLEFLKRNGFPEAELALKEDISERKEVIGSFNFEKFLFPMNLPLPPVKVPASYESRVDSSGDEEFKSLGSSTSATEFSNPYGCQSATQADSDSISDGLSQFGTAREYHEFDMQNDLWYDDKDEGPYLTPSFGGLDPFGFPSEDKFVMTSETGNSEEKYHHVENDFHSYRISADNVDHDQAKDCSQVGVKWELGHDGFSERKDLDLNWKEDILNELESKIAKLDTYEAAKLDLLLDNSHNYGYGVNDAKEVVRSSEEPRTGVDEQEDTILEEIPYLETNEDEYEVFDLRIIHRKNRTGFEESKDFPIVLHKIIAGRYYITEYLGSAAFSKVVQAHDIKTGIDVCLKIIKNDKDFFDQSLDEIKLLKFVNKHDPGDEHHILRLYDYFYHQEHLFIVCELLRANLYEFQKYNLESGAEPYFTMGRLQAIARQCLEALDYLHSLGIIHCDLKPENVLIKSYSRCEIKVIDLGSSCFQTDNLCLYVQSRSYRAPEVILGLPYDPKIDIWSLGCIMAELCSGEVLFPNDGVVMLLARIIGLLGPIDLEMLLRGQETHKYFTKEYDLYHINEDTDQMEYIIPEESSLEHHLPLCDAGFMDFIRYLLQISPRERPTARQALDHPWLSLPY